jgi:hypothetical protein
MFSKLTQLQRRRAGHKYEYYISWKLRNEGWIVEPRTKYKQYDRGIDLIATKDEKIRYIQCKGWSSLKVLHENVIDQLYGSVAYQVGPANLLQTEMFIYSSAYPSNYAREHAKRLNIQIYHEPYPRWKRKKRLN